VRLSTRSLGLISALAGALGVVVAQLVLPPPPGPADGDMRLWLVARASGLVAYGLLTLQVSLGVLMSHPTNAASWKLSKRIFPWHENLSAFLVAFSLVHVAAIVLDPYAQVDLVGAFVPGLAVYRPIPVAVGTLSLYAGLLAAVTARWTRLLPSGLWLRLHRVALLAWATAWIHGVLAGTDTLALTAWYVGTGLVLVAVVAWRYSVIRAQRRAGRAAPAAQSTPSGAPHAGHASAARPLTPEPIPASVVRRIPEVS
jgi:sulfoxide reductase heme-binding subunit YedZ